MKGEKETPVLDGRGVLCTIPVPRYPVDSVLLLGLLTKSINDDLVQFALCAMPFLYLTVRGVKRHCRFRGTLPAVNAIMRKAIRQLLRIMRQPDRL